MASAATAKPPLALLVADVQNRQAYAPGDEIEMMISSNAPGYVSCYFQRGGEFVKVFPNRFSTNGFVSSKGAIYMPDSTEYSFIAEQGVSEQLLCYLTTRQVTTDLPSRIAVEDFSTLQISNQSELDAAYKRATNGRFAKSSLNILVQ